MIVGTCYFPSLQLARRYYEPYGFDAADVARKVQAGEIRIGRPLLGPREIAFLIDDGTRWAVETIDASDGPLPADRYIV